MAATKNRTRRYAVISPGGTAMNPIPNFMLFQCAPRLPGAALARAASPGSGCRFGLTPGGWRRLSGVRRFVRDYVGMFEGGGRGKGDHRWSLARKWQAVRE